MAYFCAVIHNVMWCGHLKYQKWGPQVGTLYSLL